MTTIDSAAAVKSAYEYMIRVSPDASKFSNFRVEEISIVDHDGDDDKDYVLTLSYEIAGDFGFDKKKEYKDFRVKNDGDVIWMKIRKV